MYAVWAATRETTTATATVTTPAASTRAVPDRQLHAGWWGGGGGADWGLCQSAYQKKTRPCGAICLTKYSVGGHDLGRFRRGTKRDFCQRVEPCREPGNLQGIVGGLVEISIGPQSPNTPPIDGLRRYYLI